MSIENIIIKDKYEDEVEFWIDGDELWMDTDEDDRNLLRSFTKEQAKELANWILKEVGE